MLVTCAQIQAAEGRLFASGVDAEPLMDKAGLGCARLVRRFFPGPGKAIVFAGKGNNGGDALVVGCHLVLAGWEVELRLAGEEGDMSPLGRRKLKEFYGAEDAVGVRRLSEPLAEDRPLVTVDGLLGIGARGPLRGVLAEMAAEMNDLRQSAGAWCLAVDIPSGVNGDTGEPYGGAVIADLTATITQVKTGLVTEAAMNHVGRLALVELPEIEMAMGDADSENWLITAAALKEKLPRRPFDFHKTKAGCVGILAGSRGLTGAGYLTSLGALKGGAGLVTLFAREEAYPILAKIVPPEVMVKPIQSLGEIRDDKKQTVLAVGPGLGPDWGEELVSLLVEETRPMVIDADGLNLLSRNPGALKKFADPAGPRLLTPHPGEMARLFGGALPEGDRFATVKTFLDDYDVTLLYKGSRTLIGQRGRPVAINSTGHPGMATGGVGDVLTGLLAALIGQGLSPYDAAATGAWLSGRASELAIWPGGESMESFSATDSARHLGKAFRDLQRGAAEGTAFL